MVIGEQNSEKSEPKSRKWCWISILFYNHPPFPPHSPLSFPTPVTPSTYSFIHFLVPISICSSINPSIYLSVCLFIWIISLKQLTFFLKWIHQTKFISAFNTHYIIKKLGKNFWITRSKLLQGWQVFLFQHVLNAHRYNKLNVHP